MKRKLRAWENGDDGFIDVVDQYGNTFVKCNSIEEANNYIKEYYEN